MAYGEGSVGTDLGIEELENLIGMLKRCGDIQGAARYQKTLDQKRQAARERPLQQQVNQAFHNLRALEQKLDKAVRSYEDMDKAIKEQRSLVGILKNELESAELVHKNLVSQLHTQVSPTPAPVKWSVRDILSGNLEEIPIVLGDLVGEGDGDLELTDEDRRAADNLVNQLKKTLKDTTTALFKKAVEASDQARADHAALLERIATKRRRTEGGAGAKGGGAGAQTEATQPQAPAPAAEAPPKDGPPPASAPASAPATGAPASASGTSPGSPPEAAPAGAPAVAAAAAPSEADNLRAKEAAISAIPSEQEDI